VDFFNQIPQNFINLEPIKFFVNGILRSPVVLSGHLHVCSRYLVYAYVVPTQ